MHIITIYQGASGSGEELASAVAEALGYGSVGREVLIEASLQYGIPEAKLTEVIEREPGWWSSFTRTIEPYRIALQAALCEVAENQGIVYHGHIGHELIPKFPHVLKVLLTAPLEQRIEQVQARHRINQQAARRYVEEIDSARTRRLKGMFNADWRDASRYDLALNLGHMSLATAKHIIVETVRSPDYQVTPASRQAFADFSLASRVRARLAFGSHLSDAAFDVKVREGEISVSGAIPYGVSDDRVISEIAKVPGVVNVKAQLTNLPPHVGFDV